jgi:hypothetical protein
MVLIHAAEGLNSAGNGGDLAALSIGYRGCKPIPRISVRKNKIIKIPTLL